MSKDERMTIRIPKELKNNIELIAKELNVSNNDMVKFILYNYVSYSSTCKLSNP